ncbi:DUF3298 domain-containing protein [Fredinandcohnia sp. 179-A 10B2 NHS]|uniref:DUF3298 and DUF4163 domain-containing protein n=1 Tax=Fredinandcohnia sp. 179-A 10B2 NHS TaxID=3235176 RepID=UPI0039A39B4B
MAISFPVNIRTAVIQTGPKRMVFYPQVFGMQDERLQRYMNRWIVHETQKLIDKQVGDSPSTVVEMLGSYEIKNNQRNVVSLSLSNYTYHDRAAHGMTYIRSQTFDLQEQKRSILSDLFKPGSNYIQRISALIRTQIEQREIPIINGFTEIKPNQDFYVADRTLVIYFQLYDLTPYVYGFPFFPISVYDLQDIIREDGPLGRLSANS